MSLTLKKRADQLEAFETDPWAAKAIVEAELMTPCVVDPCCGTGVLTHAARAGGYFVTTQDIFDWSTLIPCEPPMYIGDWLNKFEVSAAPSGEWTAFMNPPFQTACEFVDRAFELGARKVICFQRFSWRESAARAEWWAARPPARIWLCVDRASCYRFDIPHKCPEPDRCLNQTAKKRRTTDLECRQCLSGTTTAHAFYVWERGHKGAEVICNLRRP